MLGDASPGRRSLIIAGVALISGLLSAYARFDIFATDFGVPILPGIYFGLVLGLATYLWAGRDFPRTGIVVFFTIVAWIAAWRSTEYVHFTITSAIRALSATAPTESDTVSESIWVSPNLPFLAGLCGLVGGLVGSSITVCGVSIAAPQLRTVPHWTRTLLIGMLLGSLLEMFVKSSFPLHIGSDVPLYVCWQMAVAASVAYGLGLKT
jgi:hypothetical protein